MKSVSFTIDVTDKFSNYKLYNICWYMYEKELAFDNPIELVYNETQPNQIKPQTRKPLKEKAVHTPLSVLLHQTCNT